MAFLFFFYRSLFNEPTQSKLCIAQKMCAFIYTFTYCLSLPVSSVNVILHTHIYVHFSFNIAQQCLTIQDRTKSASEKVIKIKREKLK